MMIQNKQDIFVCLAVRTYERDEYGEDKNIFQTNVLKSEYIICDYVEKLLKSAAVCEMYAYYCRASTICGVGDVYSGYYCELCIVEKISIFHYLCFVIIM